MQSGKLWILSKRSRNLVKTNLEDRNEKLLEVDDDQLKRKDLKKLFVDSKGLHCFLLAEHEIFYNNWNSERIF
jgi:hypothetical protein